MPAFFSVFRGAAAEHAVERIHEFVDGFVAFVCFNAGIHVWALNHNVAFGGEALVNVMFRVALEFHTDAHNALLVAEQSLHLFSNVGF